MDTLVLHNFRALTAEMLNRAVGPIAATLRVVITTAATTTVVFHVMNHVPYQNAANPANVHAQYGPGFHSSHDSHKRLPN